MIYIIAAILLVLIYLNLNYRLGYWGRRNVPFISSSVPSAIVFLFHSPGSLFDHFARIYNHFKGCKYGGIYRLFSPQFVVLDPELIKQILVKDFKYFRDRGSVIFDPHDPITNHLFSSPGDVWRGSRFGLMTIKLGVVRILQKFNLQKTPKTVYPMKFLPDKFATDCAYPVLLQCNCRN